MERRLWRTVYQMLRKVERQREPGERSAGVTYSDVLIVAVYFWQVIHDRNQQWACQRENWPGLPADWPGLPSPAQYSRRLQSPPVQGLMRRLEQAMREDAPQDWCLIVDGKPLPVGGYSKDPDARVGYGAGQFYRGYKLHAIWGSGPLPLVCEVHPANVSEPTTAAELVPAVAGEGYLLGDAAYDSSPLHEACAAAGRLLVAPRKKPGTGLGHRTRHHPQRLRSIELTEHPDDHPFGRGLQCWRTGIERLFGWLTTGANSLQNLPTHVRRLPRVRRWVQAKLLLNALAT